MSNLMRFKVSLDLLKRVMQMPEDSHIIRVVEDPFGWSTHAWFVVKSDQFEKVPEGATIPEVEPLLTTVNLPDGRAEVNWEWRAS